MEAPSHHATRAAAYGNETLKRIRRGTKSCIECRLRKRRCLWGSPVDTVCAACETRGCECLPQIYQPRSGTRDRSTSATSRDRIGRLEQQLARIAATVQDSNGSQYHTLIPPTYDHPTNEGDSPEEEDDTTFDPSEGPAATPPAHLRFLFNKALIGPDERDEGGDNLHLDKARCSKRYLDQARTKFQRLIPSRTEFLAVANYATPWLSLHMSLFPATSSIGSRDQLIAHYHDIILFDAHPVAIAIFLSAFAITALQAERNIQLTEWPDANAYTAAVGHAIETTIIAHTGLATTLEGLEAIIMYLRLLVSIGSVRNMWLTLRRTIAFAELMDLPRASHLSNSDYECQMISSSTDPSSVRNPTTQKVAIWEAICAMDRLSSMMFNLPSATSHHRFPPKQITSPEGDVMPRPYFFELAGFALKIQELDEGYTLGKSPEELYEKVLMTDCQLRTLKSASPKTWWNESPTSLSAADLVQFWHYYLTARIHLNSAMHHSAHDSEDDRFAYSRTTCTSACERICRRYTHLRHLLPPGFFICRIIDMQVFTASTYLLLSCLKHTSALPPHDLVEGVLQTMDFVAEPPAAEFVREAATAIRALVALVRHPDAPREARSLTLRIPLLGKVRIGRRNLRREPDVLSDDNSLRIPVQGAGFPVRQEYDPQMAWLMELDMGMPVLYDQFLMENAEFDRWDQAGFA